MEVVIPTRPTMDFDFNSARSSPSVTAPTTPRRFGNYYMSAPTSPSRMSEFYREFDEFSNMSNWEDGEPPRATDAATTKSPKPKKEDEFGFDDFAFDVSEEVERTSLSAEELFDGGVLRPFKPPPTTTSPRSPSFFRQVLSPRRKKGKDLPSGASPQLENTTKRSDQQQQRGRDRAPAAVSSSVSGRRATRSVSPLRVSEYQWEEEEKQFQQKQQQQNNKQLASKALFSSSTSASKAPRKWKLKDFLLFRSASEGRATDKDPFRKYSTLFKKNEDVKNSSFRSIDSPASVLSSRRRGPVSAHELHYTVNKAVSDDLKKKTFLPYKQGILGRLAFNPAVNALANGFGSLSRS